MRDDRSSAPLSPRLNRDAIVPVSAASAVLIFDPFCRDSAGNGCAAQSWYPSACWISPDIRRRYVLLLDTSFLAIASFALAISRLHSWSSPAGVYCSSGSVSLHLGSRGLTHGPTFPGLRILGRLPGRRILGRSLQQFRKWAKQRCEQDDYQHQRRENTHSLVSARQFRARSDR